MCYIISSGQNDILFSSCFLWLWSAAPMGTHHALPEFLPIISISCNWSTAGMLFGSKSWCSGADLCVLLFLHRSYVCSEVSSASRSVAEESLGFSSRPSCVTITWICGGEVHCTVRKLHRILRSGCPPKKVK